MHTSSIKSLDNVLDEVEAFAVFSVDEGEGGGGGRSEEGAIRWLQFEELFPLQILEAFQAKQQWCWHFVHHLHWYPFKFLFPSIMNLLYHGGIIGNSIDSQALSSLKKGRKHNLESTRHVFFIPIFKFMHIFLDVCYSYKI